MTETRTTCPYCGVGCGLIASRDEEDRVTLRGDPEHPANFGRLCSKGAALGETLGLEGRLLSPEIGGREAGWEEALDRVASGFLDTITKHGPDSVGFYVSGQLLTEDYYVANKLMKGFIGSANIDTNSRLCMASSVAGHKRAFGEDIVPGTYEDIDEADLVVLAGSNLAWCHPILHRRLLDARGKRGTSIVVIDPRKSATASDCDLHLAIRPGTDVLLFNGLLAHLAANDGLDRAYIAGHTTGFEEAVALATADAPSVGHVATGCDVEPEAVRRLYDWFLQTGRTVTIYSQGINQSAHGTDKVNAILNCHLATGRIGRAGSGPFSVTGQPNAMGGREVGGLANQLAAHMGFEPEAVDRLRRFWNAPKVAARPGLKALDLFAAAAEGKIKALWIMGTNPAASMPDGRNVRKALKTCPFVVVSDVTRTDTTAFADVLLPAAAWGEKDGTVTNSERRMSRQRAFLPTPTGVRPDWEIVVEVARRMGFAGAFDFPSRAAVFREHAALSAFENDGARLFDLGGLASISDETYAALTPTTWPVRAGISAERQRLLADGRFPTADGKAHFVPVRQEGLAGQADRTYPLVLNTGRSRDQWHTMTRTGRVPRLVANAPEPVCEIHPTDGAQAGIADGDLVRIESRFGFVRAKAMLSEGQRPGEAFLPMHWSGRFAANASAGSVASPVNDPLSGQPELKAAPVRITREPCGWQGVLITRRDLRPTGFVHWSRAAIGGGWIYDLTGTETADQGVLLAKELLDAEPGGDRIEYTDRRGQAYRAARVDPGGVLVEALLVARPGLLPQADWLLAIFAETRPLSLDERRGLLSGHAPAATGPPAGRIVCSCFNVGINQIAAAMAGGAASAEAIGKALGAGTNCGSCLSEIRNILDADRLQAAE